MMLKFVLLVHPVIQGAEGKEVYCLKTSTYSIQRQSSLKVNNIFSQQNQFQSNPSVASSWILEEYVFFYFLSLMIFRISTQFKPLQFPIPHTLPSYTAAVPMFSSSKFPL